MKASKGVFLPVVLMAVVLVSMPLSQSTFAANPVFGTTAESKFARNFAVPKGKAIIYIYQGTQDGRGVSPTITLNNYVIGRLVPGTFTVWKLAPGQLTIQVAGVRSAGYSLRSKPGKIYRFRVLVKQTSAGPEAEVVLMSASARNDIAATHLLKNPRSVTNTSGRRPVLAVAPRVVTKPPVTVAPSSPAPKQMELSQTTQSQTTKTAEAEDYDYVDDGGVEGTVNIGLMLKLGSMTLAEQTQFFVGADRSFDDSVSSPYSIEAYYQFSSGLTVGGEIVSYTASFTTVGLNDQHNVDVQLLMANVKQYFRIETSLQPYIGAGLGSVSTNISGPSVTSNASGLAYQLFAGLEYRMNSIGFFGELKYIDASSESDDNQKVDVSATGIFAGIAFHF